MSDIERITILLVDDHPENLIALEAVLQRPEFVLVSAHSGAEALEKLALHDVALVLLDIQMPGMDGYEVTRRIKQNPLTAHIPVVFLTAVLREDPHIVKGYEVGGVDYLTKPIDTDILTRKVGIYTQIFQQKIRLSRREELFTRLEAELQIRSARIAEHTAEIDAILESVSDAVYVVQNERICRLNKMATSLWRASQPNGPVDLSELGGDLRVISSGDDSDPYHRALKGERCAGELTIRNLTSGLEQTVLCVASPVVVDRNVVGVVLVVTTPAPLKAVALAF